MRREICGECGAPINDEGSCICTELLKKDGSGKVIKPDGWQPPDFDRFFGATDSEGGEV